MFPAASGGFLGLITSFVYVVERPAGAVLFRKNDVLGQIGYAFEFF